MLVHSPVKKRKKLHKGVHHSPRQITIGLTKLSVTLTKKIGLIPAYFNSELCRTVTTCLVQVLCPEENATIGLRSIAALKSDYNRVN